MRPPDTQITTLTPGVSVVICAYTLARWPDLVNAVTSAEQQQIGAPLQVVVVADHAPALLRAASQRWPEHTVIPNTLQRGLSGARNTGLNASKHQITAFLDDDAAAQDGWLEALTSAYHDDAVIGVGGQIDPAWQGEKPAWFPSEFLWVLGCSYTGLPEQAGPVRNVIGANMSVRTEVALAAGGFRLSLGRVGPFPLGGEETEFCVRSAQQRPGTRWIYQPGARVTHQVIAARQRRRYFLTRCFAEGLTKANVARHTGTQLALASERAYLRRTLPTGILGRLQKPDAAALSQAAAIILGTAATAAGYLAGQRVKPGTMSRLSAPDTLPALNTQPNALQPGTLQPDALQPDALQPDALQPDAFMPFLMIDLDLGAPIGDLGRINSAAESRTRARVLCSLHQVPLGQLDVDLPRGGKRAADLAVDIWQALGAQINAHLRDDHLPELHALSEHGVASHATPRCVLKRQAFLDRAPRISVIVATRNRAQKLPALLDLLLDLDYPAYELLIVDNAPGNDDTRAVVEARAASDPRLRYVREDRPGLSSARNAGVRNARAELIAVTDDDVRPVRGWLRELARGFEAGENVGCVTGAILAARLDSRAQLWTEQYGGFHKGFAPRLFGLRDHRDDSRTYPYNAGIFGSGANLAFRRQAFLQVGGFDPCLGAGSRGMGGEELAVFVQLLSAGYRIAYQPGALLYHDHHADEESLKRQMYSYGAGLSAYLTKTLWDRPWRIFDFARRAPAGLIHLLHRDSAKNRQKDANYPAELTKLEQRGLLHGPLAYVRARAEQTWTSRRNAPERPGRPGPDR